MNINQQYIQRSFRFTLVVASVAAYIRRVTGSASLVNGYVPVALSKSEGAGSVLALAWLPGAHLYKQVLGNTEPNGYCGPVTPILQC